VPTAAFLRSAALCSVLSSASTLLLIYLPRFVPHVTTFEERIALATNPIHLTRLAVSIVHPFLVLTTIMGVVLVLWRSTPGRALVGCLCFVLWAFTEAVQQSLQLVAVELTWRRAFAAATDTAARDTLRSYIEGFAAVWDGMFFLLLLAFIAGNALLAAAMLPATGWRLAVAVAFLAGAALGVISLVSSFWIPAADETMDWAYPAVQPLARLITAIWLWRVAAQGRADA
jgi:uncharacterized membrane protein